METRFEVETFVRFYFARSWPADKLPWSGKASIAGKAKWSKLRGSSACEGPDGAVNTFMEDLALFAKELTHPVSYLQSNKHARPVSGSGRAILLASIFPIFSPKIQYRIRGLRTRQIALSTITRDDQRRDGEHSSHRKIRPDAQEARRSSSSKREI